MSPATKILIVEDEDVLAENIKSFLTRSAPNVKIAGDACIAIEVLQSFTPDIVVLDYGLPGMDGIQTFARVVHSRAPYASCVMITGQLTEELTRTLYEFGIHHYLRKPFSFSELQEIIDVSLDENSVYKNNTERTVSTRRQEQCDFTTTRRNIELSPSVNKHIQERRSTYGRRHSDDKHGIDRRVT
jgi:DNA-binding response OmpR family regulator